MKHITNTEMTLTLRLEGVAGRVPITPDDGLVVVANATWLHNGKRTCWVTYHGSDSTYCAGTVEPVKGAVLPDAGFAAVAITSGDGHALKMVGVEADPRTKYCDARGAACVAMPVSVTYCHTCGARQPSRNAAN